MATAPVLLNVPTISNDDLLYLTYNGSWVKDVTVIDRADRFQESKYERVYGPFPEDKFPFHNSFRKTASMAGMTPGETRLLPAEFIFVYFGDPRSKPGERSKTKTSANSDAQDVYIATREDELMRLGRIYGVFTRLDLLEGQLPDVTIMTADNVEILPVPMDPKGLQIAKFIEDNSPVYDIAALHAQTQARLEDLTRQMNALQAMQNDPSIVKVDGPPSLA